MARHMIVNLLQPFPERTLYHFISSSSSLQSQFVWYHLQIRTGRLTIKVKIVTIKTFCSDEHKILRNVKSKSKIMFLVGFFIVSTWNHDLISISPPPVPPEIHDFTVF